MQMKEKWKNFWLLNVSTLIIVAGVYFFKFPNNFSFGGVTGLAVVLGQLSGGALSASTVSFVLNMALLVLGFVFLGKGFGAMTTYSTILFSVALSACEKLFPLTGPLTDEPMLELTFAIFLPAVGAALLFNMGASSGGTDIIAMILKKYSSVDIGRALFYTDLLITLSACVVFDVKTALFSMLGLMAKSLVIDSVIESINLRKYFSVVCQNPEPICAFIVEKLGRGATVWKGEGAFTHEERSVILTAMSRPQAVRLRQFIKESEPSAFILISNTSEIIGKGFSQ